MTSDTMDDEEGGADAPRQGRNPRSRNSRAQDTDGTEQRGQMSAEPMSGLNPDEMDGEGTAFAKRLQLPRRKKMPSGRRRYYKEYMVG